MQKNSHCTHCHRPQSRCLCNFITEVINPFPVFILQHAKERAHPKGTAKLAELCLHKCTLVCDKSFETEIDDIIEHYNPALLFPESTTENNQPYTASPKETPTNALIVIDGTWKKANKIYHTHPELHSLPRCSVNGRTNQYTNRKSPSDQHLSTLEAIAYGLEWLDQENGQTKTNYQPLLSAQSRMISHWEEQIRNHKKTTL